MARQISLKKRWFIIYSAAFLSFVSIDSAIALEVPSTGGTTGDFNLNTSANVTSGTDTNTSNTSTPTVVLNAASNNNTLQVSGGTITSTGTGETSITTSTNTTANITVDGGTITAAPGDTAITTSHNLGEISVTSGSVQATGTGTAIDLTGGTTTGINVGTSGTISAVNGDAIEVNGGSVAVTNGIDNSGHVTVSGTGDDILVSSNLNANINNTGTVSSNTGAAIDIAAPVTGTITNSGTIASNSGTDIEIQGSGSTQGITNSGIIESTTGTAIDIAAPVTGTISNTGTIESGGSAATIEVQGSGSATGITNSSTGIISSNNGIAIDVAAPVTGTITNSGTIETTGTGTAIEIQGSGSTTGITNSSTGIIESTSGMAIDVAAPVTGTISNSGTVSSTTGTTIDVAAPVTGTITNSGTIESRSGTDIMIQGSGSVEGIANTGTISSTTGTAIDVAAPVTGAISNTGTIESGGGATTIEIQGAGSTTGITNGSTGIISSNTGTAIDVDAHVTGTINNSGTIESVSGTDIMIQGSGSTQGITNSGIIESTSGTAIDVAAPVMGTISNTGTIESGGSATTIEIQGSGSTTGITNGTTGIISSNTGTAIDIAAPVTGIISNSGIVESTSGTDIRVEGSGSVVGINNTGTIEVGGSGSAIQVQGSGSVGEITNGSGGVISSTGGTAIDVAAPVTGTITNSGVIESTSGTDIRIEGSGSVAGITNSGTITTGGTGAAITVADDTRIAGGIINTGTISSTNSSAVAIDLSGQTSASNSIAVTNSGTINGEVRLGNNDTLTQTAGSIGSNGGTAILATSGSMETVNLNGGSVTGNINLSGATNSTVNLGVAPSSNVTVNGGNIAAGVIDVKAGTANVGDSITLTGAQKTVTIENGATLNFTTSNTDTLTSVTNTGTVKVDAGKAVTLTGTYNATGTTILAINSAASPGQILTTGGSAITLGNSTVNVDVSGLTGAINRNSPIVLFDAKAGSGAISQNGVNGTFALNRLVTDSSYLVDFQAKISGNQYLVQAVTGNSFASAATGNNAPIAGVLDRIIAANSGSPAIQNLIGNFDRFSDARSVNAALTTLRPNVSGQTTTALLTTQDAVIDTIEGRMELARDDLVSQARNLWGKVFGIFSDQGSRNDVSGYRSTAGGITFGADEALDKWSRIGTAFSYANTGARGSGDSANINSYQASLYGTHNVGKIYYQGVTALAYNSYNNDRTLFDNSVANGKYGGWQYTAKGGAGYNIDTGSGLKLTPFASMQYTLLTQDNYTETGSSGALHVNNNDINILKSGLGVRLAYPILDEEGVTYNPHLSAGWYYDLIGNDAVETTDNFAGTAGTFTANGTRLPRNSFKMGAGADLIAKNNVTLSLDYDLETWTSFTAQTGTLKARFEF